MAIIVNTGNPDGKIAVASRPGTATGIEIEAADDFVLTSATSITNATFTGLLTGGALPGNVSQVRVEIYRVFPALSDPSRTIDVPTRVNSPSDNALYQLDSALADLTFATNTLGTNFTANNSVLNGINPSPNQTTGGEGAVTGTEVQFSTNFSGINLPQGHYFFIPQVQLNNGGQFYWLSASRPIVSPGTPFANDLQEWVRNENLAPDWLRVGTDIVGGATPPTFNGTFSLSGQALSLGASPSFGNPPWALIGVGDFNGDGASDIAWRDQINNLTEIQLLVNTSTIGGGAIANSPFDASFAAVAIGDFNRDGISDLVYRRASDGITEVQFLQGNAGIGGGIIANNPFDKTFTIIGAGDFNGDGNADLLWRRQSDGLTEVQLLKGGTGSNTISGVGGGAITNNPFDTSFNIVTSGDFNGDGKTDLVWRRADGLTEIQFLNGNVAIGGGAIANNPFNASFNLVGVGDFNGDGLADLVWQRPADGLVEIQFMNGTTPVGGGAISGSPFGANFQVVGVGDFNADGHQDLMYRRPSDGLAEVQFLNGITPVGGGIVAVG